MHWSRETLAVATCREHTVYNSDKRDTLACWATKHVLTSCPVINQLIINIHLLCTHTVSSLRLAEKLFEIASKIYLT